MVDSKMDRIGQMKKGRPISASHKCECGYQTKNTSNLKRHKAICSSAT